MNLIMISIIINVTTSLVLGLDPAHDLPKVLFVIFLIFCLIQFLGILIIVAGRKKLGAYTVIASSAIFIPIGVIGIFGAIRVLDALKRQDYLDRKKQHSDQTMAENRTDI